MGKKWTKEEIKLLKEYYPITTSEEEITNMIPNRSYTSILIKANRLGLKKFWNEERNDGLKTCIKCKRDYPNMINYFPPDKKGTKDGLRNVCRECGMDGHFMDEGYVPKVWWTKEENKLFIERYPHYTNEELIEIHYPHLNDKQLTNKAYKLNINKTKETYDRSRKIQAEKMYGIDSPIYGIKRSEETKRKLSESKKGKYVGENNWWFGKKRSLDQILYMSKIKKESGQWKGENNPRHLYPLFGELNGNWQGGISNLYSFLRRNLSDWKYESIKRSNYKCVITNDHFDDIHHLYSFDLIVKETLDKLNIPVLKNVSDYTDEELNRIVDLFLDIHMDNLGVCLKREIHILFHSIYGYGNNTPEQFKEFKKNYANGLHKDKLNNTLTERRKEFA